MCARCESCRTIDPLLRAIASAFLWAGEKFLCRRGAAADAGEAARSLVKGRRCLSHQGTISNMLDENVVQPLLVSASALRSRRQNSFSPPLASSHLRACLRSLATECVRMILKIDGIVSASARRPSPFCHGSHSLTPPLPAAARRPVSPLGHSSDALRRQIPPM